MNRNTDESQNLENFLISMRTEKVAKAFAAVLKLEREKQGLSLRDISERTFVSFHYLEAIENGDFNKLPGDLWLNTAFHRQDHYIRSFLRAYALELGIRAVALELDGPQVSVGPEDLTPSKVTVAASESSSRSADSKAIRPPVLGEYLLYFLLTKAERVYLIGDLTEEYEQVLIKFGKRAAVWWYYKQVFDSLWPLLSRTLRKFVLSALILPKTAKAIDWVFYVSQRIEELGRRSKYLIFGFLFLLYLFYELAQIAAPLKDFSP